MAGGSVIGALRVVLGADTAQLDKGLKDAQGSLARFGAQMKNVGLVAAGALAGVIGGSAAAIKSAVNEADQLGKMAQSIGLPVEELSKLKYAAELSDISLESLSTSMVRLSKNMSAVAGGAGGPAAEAFKALGVSVKDTDGTMKSSSAVLSEVSDKFAGYEDGANKTALAVALFGKSGAAMIPMLNAGSAAIADAGKEAEAFGLVIDKKTAVAAENFNDNLTRLSKVANGLWIQIAAQLAPEFSKLSNIFVQLAKDGGIAKSGADMIAGSMSGLVQTAMTLALMWRRLGAEWNALRTFLQTDIFSGKLTENWNKFNEAGRETQLQLVQLKAKFEDDPLGNADDAIVGLSRGVGELNKNLGAAPALASGAKNALVSFLDSQAKSTAARNAEVATVGLATGALERLKVVQQATLIADQNKIAVTPLLNAQIAATGDAAALAALKLEGMNLIQQSLAPHEVFRFELEKNRLALASIGGTAEQVARVNQSTAEKFGASWQQAVPSVLGSFQEIASGFGQENAKMAKAAQIFGASQAFISTLVGQAKALELPFPANFAAMAAIAAKGFALVAAIKSQKSASVSAMTGGSFKVPGSGGPDSKSYNMNLSPGEQVDIWRPGEGTGDPRGGGGRSMTEVTVNMAGEVFNRETFRKLIDGLNDMQADGYRLKIA